MRTKIALPLVLMVLFLAACATLYSSVVSITSVVDVGMTAYADASVNGHSTPVIDAKVKEAHDKYRAACGIAKNALIAYKSSGDPAGYEQAVASAKDAAQALLDLITPLIAPDKATTLQTQLQNAKTL